jgi:hypothetical protein
MNENIRSTEAFEPGMLNKNPTTLEIFCTSCSGTEEKNVSQFATYKVVQI